MLFFGIGKSTCCSFWPAVFVLALFFFTHDVDARGIGRKFSAPGAHNDANAGAVGALNWANGNGGSVPAPAISDNMKSEGNGVKGACTSYYAEDDDDAYHICQDFLVQEGCPTGTLYPKEDNYYRCCTNC